MHDLDQGVKIGELRKCPFCGKRTRKKHGRKQEIQIECGKCGWKWKEQKSLIDYELVEVRARAPIMRE